jgi:hypothetical protein
MIFILYTQYPIISVKFKNILNKLRTSYMRMSLLMSRFSNKEKENIFKGLSLYHISTTMLSLINRFF